MANKGMALGSRPKAEFEKKLVGLVEVVTGKAKAKFTLTEEGKTFNHGETSITVNLADLPSRPKLKPEVKEPKMYRIRMSQDGSEIEAITPAMGHFHAKLVDLGPRPDGKESDPLPREKIFGEGTAKENSHWEFFAVYQITEGAFKGVELPAFWMHYKFEEDPEHEGYTRFAGNFENKKATRLFQLKDWGDAHDLWSEPVEWDDVTILPTLLDRALENDRIVDLTIKDGYIRELLPVESEDDAVDPMTDKPAFMDDEDDLDAVLEKSAKSKNGKSPVKPVKKIKKAVEEEDEL